MRQWRWRFLTWRVQRQPTHCRWAECGRPLPAIRVDRVYCSETCADEDWLARA